MRLIISVFFTVFILVSVSQLRAQENKVFINQSGQVVETTGSAPANAYYIDKAGHLHKVGGSGIYTFNGESVVPLNDNEGARGGEEKKLSPGGPPPKYYIGSDMKMHQVEDGWPARSFYTNEYGKLLENKGRKKPNNSTN